MAIIGIIAAIAIPNLLGYLDKARQKSTMANMRQLSNAVTAYMIDSSHYPIATTMSTVESLDPKNMGIEPIYITSAPTKDGWGGALYYGSDTTGVGSDYTISSYGKDKKVSSNSAGATNSFDCDIIFQNGSFTAAPEGAQN